MAARKKSSVRVGRDLGELTAVLASAFFEWLLIFLLFINGLFSYVLTRFACFFKLQIPCVLCSRLDHVVGNEKPGFYWDLICGDHKSEISSLVFCHAHDKLADVHGMCESCLFSFATENKSNSETYRLLVGKLGCDVDSSVNQDPLFKDDMLESLSEKQCCCCHQSWTSRLNTHRLLQGKSIVPELNELDIALPASLEKSRLSLHDGSEKSKERSSLVSSKLEDHSLHPLSHIGYTELKISSDSESEVHFSDDDDANCLVPAADDLKEEFIAECESLKSDATHGDVLLKIISDDLDPAKMIKQTSKEAPFLIAPKLHHDVYNSQDLTSTASAAALGHDLEDLNWHKPDEKADPSPVSEFVSQHIAPSSSNVGPNLGKPSENTLDVIETNGIGMISIIERGKTFHAESGSITRSGSEKTDQALNGPALQATSLMDLSDAYKLISSNKGNQVSNMLAERFNSKDSARLSEDLKLLMSQLSAARGFEFSLNEMSPRLHLHGDDSKILDASSPTGLHILQKRISLERNESGLESLDGSIVNEIEGESVVDRLKRQVEYDRKSMSALYKELEEERNASAVAANQAMAMITRLQEEKATLQMEALQYLRMMEEQAEYDVDALQKANELIAEKEKQVQELQEELAYHKKGSLGKSMLETTQDFTFDPKQGDMRVEQSEVTFDGDNISNSICKSLSCGNSEGRNEPETIHMVEGSKTTSIRKDSLVNYEDEKLYISQCLKTLEKKLRLFSNNGINLPNGGYSEMDSNGVNHHEQLQWDEAWRSKMEEEDSLLMQDTSLSSRSPSAQKRRTFPFLDPQFVGKEDYHPSCNMEGSIIIRETELVSLEHEVSDLNERLNAIEADRNFLEHTVNSLRSRDGVQFIQEIAHHLQELRRIGIKREQAFP